MDSMVWRGCWRVTRRYFCSDRLSEGKTAWAASYGLSACFRPPAKRKKILVKTKVVAKVLVFKEYVP